MLSKNTTDKTLTEKLFGAFPTHLRIAMKAINLLDQDPKVLGLYLSGSFSKGKPDNYSDIDINILVEEPEREQIIKNHSQLIHDVGKIAAVFPATHLGDPNQIIVFYEEEIPIHVDYQYRIPNDLKPKFESSGITIIIDKNGTLNSWQKECKNSEPYKPDVQTKLQYYEDRFWAWCSYTDSKIKRGERWEARDAIEYVRSNVILTLTYFYLDLPNEGARRLEIKFPKKILDLLSKTAPVDLDEQACKSALLALIDIYQYLFKETLEKDSTLKISLVDRNFFIKSFE